jgi:hypothetical protein
MRLQMAKFVEEEPSVKINVNEAYITRFKERYGLSTRAVTHQAQENNKHPDDIWLQVVKWIIFLNQVSNKYPKCRLYNADEVPYWMDAASKKTVDVKGKKTINVKSTGQEKTRFTVVKTCRADGKMLKPFIIFKGLQRVPVCCVALPNAIVKVNNSGSMDGKMFLDYIKEVIEPDLHEQQQTVSIRGAMFMFDRASAHLVDYVAIELEQMNVETVPIEPGMTSSTQPLDVAINAVSKGGFKEDWSNRMRSSAEFTRDGNRKRFPYSLLVEMVVTSLAKVTPAIVQNSFVTCGLCHYEDSFTGPEFLGRFQISI